MFSHFKRSRIKNSPISSRTHRNPLRLETLESREVPSASISNFLLSTSEPTTDAPFTLTSRIDSDQLMVGIGLSL